MPAPTPSLRTSVPRFLAALGLALGSVPGHSGPAHAQSPNLSLQCPRPDQGEVSVLWWNVRFGQLRPRTLERNLRSLLAAPCPPDVLALGEYEPGQTLPRALEHALNRAHRFIAFVPYNEQTPHRGIWVASRLPVRTLDDRSSLSWLPRAGGSAYAEVAKDLAIQTYSEEEVRYFDRTFTRLVVETPRGPLGLIPTHLLQHLAPLAERRSSLLAVFDLMANLNNPLGRQLTSLIQKLQERYGPSLDQNEGFALFGDLNFPSTVGFQHAPRLRTPYFQRLQAAGLTDAFSGQGPASFPTRHAPEARDPLYQLHPLQLDHAWASPGVGFRSPEILTLEGSDHYPLFFIARASGRDAEP